jgi:sphingomyelin phosphodiesterase 4
MTKNTAPSEFDVLYNFFIPLGPMFRLCYRLLSDTVKYEVAITKLPVSFHWAAI